MSQDPNTMTRAELRDLAADLSAELGHEVKASTRAISDALASPEGSAWFAQRKGSADPAAPPKNEAQAIDPAEPPKPSAQRVEGFAHGELDGEGMDAALRQTPLLTKPATKRSGVIGNPFSDLPDEVACIQLVGGPNAALSDLAVRRGDVIVSPSAEIISLFSRGVQHAHMTLGQARAQIATGKGRFNRALAPSFEG